MKQKNNFIHTQSGFTLVELLVVLGIMVLVTGLIVIDFNRQKSVRNIVLAKNETVTNLRKVQGYMLSSKNISANIPAKYYIVEFNSGATSYTVDAVDSQYNFYNDIETIALPSGVSFVSLTSTSEGDGLVGDGNKDNKELKGKDKGETVVQDGGNGLMSRVTSYKCIQVIFSAPFGTMYARGADTCGADIVDILRNPVYLAQLSQGTKYLNFESTQGSTGAKYIQLSPITGQITVN